MTGVLSNGKNWISPRQRREELRPKPTGAGLNLVVFRKEIPKSH
jgi:hypothetical protein